MGLNEQLSGPSNRIHDFVGTDAVVVNRTVDYENRDSQGDPTPSTDRIETTAEVAGVGSGSFERRFSGIDVDASASVWLPSGTDVYDGTEDDARRSSRILVDGETYEVVDVTTESTGRIRCLCNKP